MYLGSGGGHDSQDLITRFQLNNNGWEVYSYTTGAITLRHHHAAGATTRTGCYSLGWDYNTWYFMGISRSGTSAQFYRGTHAGTFGAVDTICDTLIDPEACAQPLTIGTNTGATSNFHKGMFWRYRVWGDRALTAEEWEQIYRREQRWFSA